MSLLANDMGLFDARSHKLTNTHTHVQTEFLRSNFIQCDFPGEHPQEPEPQPQH